MVTMKKGNRVTIGNVMVRSTNRGTYEIIDATKKKVIATTNFRSCALAIAKQWSKGRDVINKIMKIDNQLLKHNNDIVFYKHTLTYGTQIEAKQSASVRYEISLGRIEHLMEIVKRYIYY